MPAPDPVAILHTNENGARRNDPAALVRNRPDRLPTATLGELGDARVALFFSGVAADQLPPSVNPSATTLYENWDDRMESGC